MTTVSFETALLAECLKKAARIAPMKGRELDRYAGILIELEKGEDDEWIASVRATDGQVFYTEWINTLEVEGEPVQWRVPSKVTSGIINALPIGSNKKCTFTEDGGKIRIQSDRTRASVGLITSSMPPWENFDPSVVEEVPGFGMRLDQVAWAADKSDTQATSGIFLDGENIVATDGMKLATAPLGISMQEDNVLVPLVVIAPILSQMRETRAAIQGNYLLLMPTNYTQIKCVLMGDSYPSVSRLMNQETEETILFNREHALEIVQRIMTIVAKDQQNNLDVTVGNGEISFYTEDEAQVNSIDDALSLDGQCNHGPVKFRFTPSYFLSAISKSPGLLATMSYTPSNPKQPVRFEGEAGFKCWVMPRRQA